MVAIILVRLFTRSMLQTVAVTRLQSAECHGAVSKAARKAPARLRSRWFFVDRRQIKAGLAVRFQKTGGDLVPSAPMDLVLIRHGRPIRIEDAGGPADPALTDLGHRQAQAMAASLSDERFDALYVSPMLRARQTANPLEETLGLTASIVVLAALLAWVRRSPTISRSLVHSLRMEHPETSTFSILTSTKTASLILPKPIPAAMSAR